ncbi:PREDICTED: transcription elongation factor 1 homolog [Trachymyrmex septentrionalis]|uniref:transcription elongation factor 1 homolog n=1 Tax=Trachymyrmex septentrionalis TaxID=34720 RepID=UPI00084EF5FD|nr:PREDICTED: transcription elongation factor 1 homolog [Trachymyrmex septentrionalis]
MEDACFRCLKMGNNMERQRSNIKISMALFTCPFCKQKMSCYVKINREKNIGRIKCNKCKRYACTNITYLMTPIQVFMICEEKVKAAAN